MAKKYIFFLKNAQRIFITDLENTDDVLDCGKIIYNSLNAAEDIVFSRFGTDTDCLLVRPNDISAVHITEVSGKQSNPYDDGDEVSVPANLPDLDFSLEPAQKLELPTNTLEGETLGAEDPAIDSSNMNNDVNLFMTDNKESSILTDDSVFNGLLSKIETTKDKAGKKKKTSKIEFINEELTNMGSEESSEIV